MIGFHYEYEITSNGEVFIIKNNERKILKTYDNGTGYKMVSLRVFKKYKLHYVHRLVAKYFIENPNFLNEVNHIDFDKSNNSINNLEWCSRIHNMKHYYYTKFDYTKQKIKSNKERINTKHNNVCYIDLPYCIDFYKYTQKWRLRFRSNGIRKHIGYFKTYNDAINKISLLSL